MSNVLHDHISTLHTAGGFTRAFPVACGCASSPGQAMIPACNERGPMQNKLLGKCVSMCTFG